MREFSAFMEAAGCSPGCEVRWEIGRAGPPRVGFRHYRPGTLRSDYHTCVDDIVETLKRDHEAWAREVVDCSVDLPVAVG